MNVNNLKNLSLNFHNSRLRIGVKLDNLQADLKENLMFTNNNQFEFSELEMFTCNDFLETPNALCRIQNNVRRGEDRLSKACANGLHYGPRSITDF